MKRRVALGSLLAAAMPVWAQTPARIGYISRRSGPNEFEQAFLRGMRERGLVEGRDFVIEYKWANGDAQRLKSMAAELADWRPKVLVAEGSGARAVWAIDPAIPAVNPMMGDPILQGYTHSLSRPDGNITGTSALRTELSGKRLELLKEIVPGVRRAGAIFNVATHPKDGLAATRAAGDALGIAVVDMPLRMPDGIGAGIANAAREGVQGLVVISDTATISYRSALCEAARVNRLPAVFSNRTYLRGGGLVSYGPSLESAFERSAYFVERIIKGAIPADLPIELATQVELVVNLKIAEALRLAIPDSVLRRADEVIRS
jgi:putative ABC transport system substrate-binding protein